MSLAQTRPAPDTPPRLDRLTSVRAEQIRLLFRNAPIGLTGAMAVGVLVSLAVFLSEPAMARVAVVWFAALTGVFLAHVGLCRAYKGAPSTRDWRPWAFWFSLACLCEGLTWGGGSIVLMTTGGMERELSVMVVVVAVASCSTAVFGAFLPAFLLFMLPTMTPYLLWTLFHFDGRHGVLFGLDAIYIVAVSAVGWRAARTIVDILNLRFENSDLVEDLREQTRRAEEASVSKSRFLASASHDLRQPIHALSMFVGALRHHDLDAEARRILEHVDRSIDAMDTLFSALLNISRLDAGVIERRLAAFPIQPMLERIVADHAVAAREKGIAVTLRPCSLTVFTDPILLERILRNFVSNAVSFTRVGRVVVGCRRGRLLRIAVFDTGPGIPLAEQGRIFEEFYQIANPERDRTKGLGLGLAIVSRLAAMLDCPVALRSMVNKGSVFSVSVPIASGADIQILAGDPDVETVTQGLVLVVDNETMIQEAMRTLLKSWGFDVIVAGSCAEMLDRTDACPDVPSLIISDLRLRDHENGIDVIRELQAQYNEDIPGLLITGDTSPDRIRQSAESGFQLLHKPIAPGRLQKAINEILAMTSARHEA